MKFSADFKRFIEQDSDSETPAVVGSDRTLKWSEFKLSADRWVERAQKHGIRKDHPVIIHGHKEAAFLVAIAGSLTNGSPFIPVDTIYPEERKNNIVRMTNASFIYDTTTDEFIATNLNSVELEEKDLAYIMFTSGSTGEPKGVQIGRECVEDFVSWMKSDFSFGVKPIFMNQAPFSFDLSMYEVFGFLSTGGTCVLMSRDAIADEGLFFRRLEETGVSVWVSTPSFAYQQSLSKSFESAKLPALKTFLFCGEPLPNALARRLLERFPNSRILNTYGPTEATVATTLIAINRDIVNRYDPLPVGYAKPGSDIYIDKESTELSICGINVMRGYLNNVELNRDKMFVRDGMRGFKTGDAGMIDDDGLIFCKGRLDDQIKLNGYRIEIAEIEHQLRRLPGVENGACVPLKRPDGSVIRLVGFVVRAKESESGNVKSWMEQVDTWKSHMANAVPIYMIPSEFVNVETLPMSSNHKVDKAKLSEIYRKQPY